MRQRWVPLLIVGLLLATPAEAANLRVGLVSELSDDLVWRFELVNDSVDALDIQRLTVTFLANGRRLWALSPTLTQHLLQRGDSAWVFLDARQIPKVRPLEMIWEITWNPHGVPVLPRFWQTERVAHLEIVPPSAARGATRPAEPHVPRWWPEVPTRSF